MERCRLVENYHGASSSTDAHADAPASSTTSKSEFNHDLVFVDEFDALSIELKGLPVARYAASPSVQHVALRDEGAPPVAVREASSSSEPSKKAPELGKFPARDHARKVAKELGVVKGLIYLPGQVTQVYEDSDQGPLFHQRRYFYYITGANVPNCAVTYDIAHDNLILWIPYVEPREALYSGAPPSPEELKARSDLSDVRFTPELPRYLRTYLCASAHSSHPQAISPSPSPTTIFILHSDQTPPIDPSRAPGILVLDSTRLLPAMDDARLIKTPYEVEAIRRANAVSSAAHRSVLGRLRHMTNEREIEALFRAHCLAVGGASHQAYPVIVGSGSNAATLHYADNNEALEGRQLVVLDAGCEWELYASDITRTLPLALARGEEAMSPEARAIYSLVERMQESCIAAVRPGLPNLALYLRAMTIAVEGLLGLGILRDGTREQILSAGTGAAFFPHGLGHHVGLDVHDVGASHTLLAWRRSSGSLSSRPNTAGSRRRVAAGKREMITPEMLAALYNGPYNQGKPVLRENMIITIEPGLYFSRQFIETLFLPDPRHAMYIDREVLERYYPVGGVRIEDDILVTKDGYENLSTAPKGEEAFRIIRGEES